MVGYIGRIATGAWLLGTVAVAPLAQAEPARTWSDPPPDLNVTPLTAPSEAAKPAETQDRPDPAAHQQPEVKTTRPNPALHPNKTGMSRAPQKEASEATQAAATRKAQEERAERIREQKAKKAREERIEKAREEREAQARRLAAAQERRKVAQQAAMVRQAQAPQRPRYEVMRLRTLLLPDGRMVDVLTRPDQEILDLPFD